MPDTQVLDTWQEGDLRVDLYDDKRSFTVHYQGDTAQGELFLYSEVTRAEHAWGDWFGQPKPDEVTQFIQGCADTVAKLNEALQSAVGAANDVAQTANVVHQIAEVVEWISYFTGVGSPLAGAMKAIQSGAIATIEVAHSICTTIGEQVVVQGLHLMELQWKAMYLHKIPVNVASELSHAQTTLESVLRAVQELTS